MSAVRRISTNRVTADFFTSAYRFSASINVHKKRLVDVLSDRLTDYLDLTDIYISRINDPGDIIATYPTGSIVKSEITFILLADEVEGTSRERFYTFKEIVPVFISVPSFEIHGQLQWIAKEFNVKKILSVETNNFLPMTDATASNSLVPKVTFQGPMILVNKSKIQVLCRRQV